MKTLNMEAISILNLNFNIQSYKRRLHVLIIIQKGPVFIIIHKRPVTCSVIIHKGHVPEVSFRRDLFQKYHPKASFRRDLFYKHHSEGDLISRSFKTSFIITESSLEPDKLQRSKKASQYIFIFNAINFENSSK